MGLELQADLAWASAMEYLLRSLGHHPWLEQGSPVTMITGAVPTGVARGSIVTDGLMLVGDAHREADPLTGGGIAHAMLAGRLAAEVAAQAVEAGDVSALALRAYEKRWTESRGRKMGRNYSRHVSRPPRESHTASSAPSLWQRWANRPFGLDTRRPLGYTKAARSAGETSLRLWIQIGPSARIAL